jgi:MSHA biogenesis protein MshN
MSLINKMLRDLDARKAGEGARARLPAAVTPLAARVERKNNLPWLAMAAVVLIALAAWLWHGMRQPAVIPIPQPSTPPDAAPYLAAAPLPVPQPSAAKAPPPPKPVAPSPRLSATASPGSSTGQQALTLRKETALHTPPASSGPPASGLFTSSRDTPPPIAADARIEKKLRLPTPAERAETAYRRGLLSQQQGQAEDALGSYRVALTEQAEHVAARQALVALLIGMRRFDEAEEVLSQGLTLAPTALPSALALARLKVERGAVPAALDLLLGHATAGERSAEYQGFLATLLNRAGRRSEAIERYQAATRLAPNEARWWAGLGLALEAEGKRDAAREAYAQARALPGLPDDLAQQIEQRLRQ